MNDGQGAEIDPALWAEFSPSWMRFNGWSINAAPLTRTRGLSGRACAG